MYSLEILTLHHWINSHWINWMYFRTLNQPFWAPDFYNLCQSSKKPLLIAHVRSSFSYYVGLIFCCWFFFFFFLDILLFHSWNENLQKGYFLCIWCFPPTIRSIYTIYNLYTLFSPSSQLFIFNTFCLPGSL